MTRRRLPILGAAILLAALLLTSCSGDQGASKGDPVAGKELFAANGCNGCHTFKAAGSTGTTGPDLDAASPSAAKVMHQLDNPGGLMPSFADKLSDDEKRNLAAFVGASNELGQGGRRRRSGRTPSASRTAATATSSASSRRSATSPTTRAPSRRSRGWRRCRRPNAAVAGDCHRIAHRMGSAALSRFKDKVAPAFIAGSPVCASGYYHGIIERAFLGQPTNKLGVVARQMCTDSQITKQTFLLYQCIHGLGHGLMIYTGYDLPLSLTTCKGLRTDFDKISCSGGVFMENFSSSYGVTSKYLRKNDPIYPCNDKISDPYKVQCYGLVTANLLKTTGYDQKKTAAGCKRSEPEWVGTCFESFGRDVSGIAGRSAVEGARELPPSPATTPTRATASTASCARSSTPTRRPSAAGASASRCTSGSARAASPAWAR